MEASLLNDEVGLAVPRPAPGSAESALCAPGSIGYAPVMRKGTTPDPLFTAEVLSHGNALHHFAWHLSRDAVAAEDLVQETFARCFSAQDRFLRGTKVKAWLFRILRNAYIDGRRRSQRNPVQRALDVDSATDEDEWTESRLRGDIEIDRLRSLVAEDIDAALQTLSPDSRLAVLMDLEGFSEAEMASVFGCPPGTIKSRLSRARGVLRVRLKDYAR